MRRFLLPGLALLVAAPLSAQQAAPTGNQHDVRRGDTLWDLSGQYLGNPFRWPEIWDLNRDIVTNPHLIYPRELLRIPGYNYPLSGAPQDGPAPRTVFFPEDQEAASRLLLGSEDAAVASVTAGDFYAAGFLAPDAPLPILGDLAEVLSPSILPVPLRPQIGLYSRVFMPLSERGRSELRVGDRVHLWRPGRVVPAHGRIFESTGMATVVELNGDVATVEVQQLFDAVRIGDFALPVREFAPTTGALAAPAATLEGRILAFEEPHALHSVHDLAFVDLGERSGVREGDEFVVVIPESREHWGVRPEIPVARLRVVRTEGGTSAARVIHLDQPALQPGLPIRLVGKMP